MYYAVIDTNVLVSALLSADFYKSAPGKVVGHMLEGEIIPIYSEEILAEYRDVLQRAKFHFPLDQILLLLNEIKRRGIYESRLFTEEVFSDPDDAVFYEVTLAHTEKEAAYLVTCNTKHFPVKPFVVTPRQMIDLIENPPLLTALPDPYILEMETKDKGAFGRGFRLLAWEGGSLWSRSFLFASAAATLSPW